MRKNNVNNSSPITKICNYCDKHKKLYNAPWKMSKDERGKDEIVSNSPVDWSDRRALFRSNAIIQKFKRRKQYLDLPSQTSCLKSIGNSKMTENKNLKKRVNFYNEQLYQPKSLSPISNISSCCIPTQYINQDSGTIKKKPQLGERNYERRLLKSPDVAHEKHCLYRQVPIIGNGITEEMKAMGFNTRQLTECQYNVAEATINAIDPARGSVSKMLSRKELRSKSQRGRSSGSSSTVNVDKDLLKVLNRMSLNSSARYSSDLNIDVSQKPRVVKPRDGLKRAGLKRMLIYPPEGQQGSPLTLLKTWSNIDCQVSGSDSQGFRYKVYYIQKFESDKWFPNAKTGSPFHTKEDVDCSTDYG